MRHTLCDVAQRSNMIKRVVAGQRGGGCEIRTREGLPPTRFPTMLTGVHRRPLPSATCPNATGAAAGEWHRTQVNETETETGDWQQPCTEGDVGGAMPGERRGDFLGAEPGPGPGRPGRAAV